MATVDVNPTVPLGSESLKGGPARFKAIAAAVLQMLGFSGAVDQTFAAPFLLIDTDTGKTEVVIEPTTPLGIATLSTVGKKGVYATVTGDGTSYIGAMPSTPITEYDPSAIYIIANGGSISGANPITLQLGSGPIVELNRSDGSPLQFAGEFGLGFYLVVFDSTNFRIINYIGGPVPNPVQLPADPTEDLQAAPKQYVDTTIGHPEVTTLNAPVVVTHDATTIRAVTVTTPTEPNSYLVCVSYSAWVRLVGDVSESRVAIWVDINGSPFALSSVSVVNDNDDVGRVSACNGCIICPTVFTEGVSITITLKGQAIPNGSEPTVETTDVNVPSGPATNLTVSFMRTSA